jgi:CRP-like cAMP-binding protein
MSPARQANSSPRKRRKARPTPIDPTPRAVGPRAQTKKRHLFDPHAFLATIAEGRKFVLFPKKQGIFSQGDIADAVFYVQTGKVKLTVVSKTGKEATIGILGEGDFFGEACLAGQALRMGSASAMTDCAVLRIDKKAMMEALHRKHEFSDLFVRICWHGISVTKRIWLISFLIRAKGDWHESFYSSRVLVRKACRRA